jgi:hypothetical protein
MKQNWEEKLSCETACQRCGKALGQEDVRFLSVYDHQPICEPCKDREEQNSDYAEVSKRMIGQCMAETELTMMDPAGHCYHHFYPYRCT